MFKKIVIILLLIVIIAGIAFCISRPVVIKATFQTKYMEEAEKYAHEFNVEEALILSVINCESSFRSDSVSSAGAYGLMQLQTDTCYWVLWRLGEAGLERPPEEELKAKLLDPDENIRLGTAMLSLLIEHFGSVRTSLAAYHAGWNVVDSWLQDKDISKDGVELDDIPYKDTESYVNKVLLTADIYRKKLS